MVGGLLIGWYPTTGPAKIAIAVVLLLWLRFALLWLGIFLGLKFRGPGRPRPCRCSSGGSDSSRRVRLGRDDAPWLGTIAEWNPVSATATAARELFGNPTGTTSGWLAENAVLAASSATRDHRSVPAARGGGVPAPAALTRAAAR